MALAINIEDLLNKQKLESNRIEFKKGWNPVSIYHNKSSRVGYHQTLNSRTW